MNRKLLLTGFILLTLKLHAQIDTSKRLSLNVQKMPVLQLLELLHERYRLNIAFSHSYIPPNALVTIIAQQESLEYIISSICQQTGLSVQYIGNAIVFNYQNPVLQDITSPPQTKPNDIQRKDSRQNNTSSMFAHLPLDTIREDILYVTPRLPSTIKIHKTPLPIPSLKTKRRKLHIPISGTGLFGNYALDFHQFHFEKRELKFQKYRTTTNNSFTFGSYVHWNAKIFLAMGVGYASRDFNLLYNFQVLDKNDPMPIPDQTQLKLTYLEIPVSIGILLFKQKQISLWTAAAFIPAYLKHEKETTTYQNTGNPNTQYFINANSSTLYNISFSLIAHYKLHKRCGIFVESAFLYGFHAVNTTAMKDNPTTIRLKSGLQFCITP